jgi:hypothetical protein
LRLPLGLVGGSRRVDLTDSVENEWLCAQILRELAGCADADVDRLALQLAQLAFWLMAATDGHAKNFSFFLQREDAYAMTPLYDVISVWPYIGEEPANSAGSAGLAMAVRAKSVHYALHTPASPALACPGEEERRTARVASDARTVMIRSRRPSPPSSRPSAVLSGANLGRGPDRDAVTGASVRMGSKRAGTLAIRHQLEDDYY